MEHEIAPIYILVLSKVVKDSIDRKSYSFVINEFLTDTEEHNKYTLPEEHEMVDGIRYTPETLPEDSIINYILKWSKENNQWMDWMNSWTHVTLYMLYQGNSGGIQLA